LFRRNDPGDSPWRQSGGKRCGGIEAIWKRAKGHGQARPNRLKHGAQRAESGVVFLERGSKPFPLAKNSLGAL